MGRVLLDNVRCSGSETALWDCSRSEWEVIDSSCENHTRDAAVVCSDGKRDLRIMSLSLRELS